MAHTSQPATAAGTGLVGCLAMVIARPERSRCKWVTVSQPSAVCSSSCTVYFDVIVTDVESATTAEHSRVDGERFAGGYAVLYANDLHNTTPASGAMVGQSPHEGFRDSKATAEVFRLFWMPGVCASPGQALCAPRKVCSSCHHVACLCGERRERKLA
jgi:hypothetical protein